MERCRVLLIVAVVGLSVCLAACGSGDGSGSSTGPVSTTFTYDTNSEVMVGWDPSASYSNEIIAMGNMYETLTRYNAATEKVEPLLATSWKASSDARTWTFQLRPGVTFHTGRPMTAQAAKAAIDRAIKLNQGAAYIWSAVKSIDAPSPDTLVFHLKDPAPLDLNASATYAAYIYDTTASGSEPLESWFAAANDAGTGPYTVDTWNAGQETELTLKAFPEYWGGWDGTHYERVVYRVVPQDTTASQLLTAGEVSFVQQMTPSLWETMKQNPDVQTVSASSWQNLFGLMNTQTGPLADVKVRQAVSYAVDYEGIVAALKGGATPCVGIVPPGLWGAFDDLPVYTYDVDKATQLLNEAGYGPGKKPMNLTMTITQGNALEQTTATIVKANLAQVNVAVQVQPLAWATQWAKARSADPERRQDILVMYWWPDYADPYSWFVNLFQTQEEPYFNLCYYSNPELDATMTEAAKLAATDRAASSELYRDMQVTLQQDAPSLNLYVLDYQYSYLKSVGNLVVNPAYPNVIFVYDLEPLPS